MSALGLLQIPGWAFYEFCINDKDLNLKEKFATLFKPASSWGPLDENLREEYDNYRKNIENKEKTRNGLKSKILNNLFN